VSRAERFDSNAGFWKVVAWTLNILAGGAMWGAGWGAINQEALVTVGLAVLMVGLFYGAFEATSRSDHWKLLADSERHFEPLETLSSPRWHGATTENNDN
jgi:hypothetical protein